MTINETINQVQGVFNDIEGALQERGVDTSNLKPTEYASAIKNAVQNVTVEDINFIPTLIFKYVTDQGVDTKRPDTPVGGN
jgi:tRNA isopentenyl-2-thiomethyl-A-37 hydroxylase MiaE